uniref:Uncharacterized protein n=1 Tax=Alexandrium monilatum TaxID=311494 RepID=A0A7S4Q2E2_9DINO|mmetsp:Transcript_64702/g.192825  ORF Transcript_64702/g.192825 Transcript_64702/m.192825 type:complete len:248 (-) Transcript_64702:30-773(-)
MRAEDRAHTGTLEDDEEQPVVRTYELLGGTVSICEGEAVLSNTGWRTWAGAWLLTKYLEKRLGRAEVGCTRRVLDLSCGTGLAGVSLACAGHEVVLCDLEVNVPTICENLGRNLPAGVGPDGTWAAAGTGAPVAAVGYTWGAALREEMRRAFDFVLCGDLLFHVWSGRLQVEFFATIQELHLRGGAGGPEFIFGGQIRSGRQEKLVLDSLARRLGLVQEELEAAGGGAEECPLQPHARYRLTRLRPD